MREPLDLRDDGALTALLAELRDDAGGGAPFAIDVADRVMARIALSGEVPRPEVGLGQLARWAAAAAVTGIGLLTVGISRAPSLTRIVGEVGMTTAEGTSLAVRTGGNLTFAGVTLAETGATLVSAARATAAAVTPDGAIGAAVAATVLLMIGVTTYVVGRDFRATTR